MSVQNHCKITIKTTKSELFFYHATKAGEGWGLGLLHVITMNNLRGEITWLLTCLSYLVMRRQIRRVPVSVFLLSAGLLDVCAQGGRIKKVFLCWELLCGVYRWTSFWFQAHKRVCRFWLFLWRQDSSSSSGCSCCTRLRLQRLNVFMNERNLKLEKGNSSRKFGLFLNLCFYVFFLESQFMKIEFCKFHKILIH